ncbi:DUF1097 domain-containing protein [Clostridium botulinum]|uniref:DUF1097 domain-containing protein n=1 Tax=Clostridium TaxID=1485 RepID=UPI0005068DF7|nr:MULTISPECIES: DUF1097 domain-containing protein [Clostridium]AIY80220.1 hypothetical protein U728_1180 [Clostridium botulinum 202F]KAI3347043.1 DUF1097 domain-containing protein [Clostridium botulinum]KFX55472.1 membrane protein [Clostridium botulinum]KON13623.1 membrane protein [Clostridium botulinum]MBN1078026.1 DUF1097 domain-containing protein [Clostridium botulinum]
MSSLFSLSLTTAILCGAWMIGADAAGLIAWAGFAGCTTFFAAGGKKQGFKSAICTNISGVFWAMLSIKVSAMLGFPQAGVIMTIVTTFFLCIQSKISLLAFIPGAFVGSFSTFAANGDWMSLIPSLFVGAVLGFLCEWTGNLLYEKCGKKEEN